MNTRKLFCFFITLAGLVLVVFLALHPQPTSASTTWFVAPGGDDANDCQSPGTACFSIQSALDKPGFLDGDTILVATGTYTGTGNQVLLINKSADISGGWDDTFSTQDGVSVVDGENTRQGIFINKSTTIDHFTIQRGSSIEGGGVFIQFGGTLTLNQSNIGDNQANSGGGIFSAWGTLNVNNSTLHNNFANGGGGINNLGGSVSLNSSTISGNAVGTMAGGGIRNEAGGSVTLQNTIIAGNTGNSGPDCNGTFNSSGYNLIEDTSGCTFSSSTGDLLNTNPGLFPVPLGSPSFYALLPNSPAIDAGNPGGCEDHQGSSLPFDQRGIGRVGRCDIGAYEYDPVFNPLTSLYVPSVARNYCADFFDDFSNPNSGWPVFDYSDLRAEYLNGEYRLLTKSDEYIYLWGAPTCERENYVLEVDARWVGSKGESYGLIFGMTGVTPAQMYIFEVSADYQDFRLYRFDDGHEIVSYTYSSAIKGGFNTNHLKVTRNGSQISLEINGTVLGTWQDSAFMGSTGVGFYTLPYDGYPTSDVRFDNFSVKSLTSGSNPSLSGETPVSHESGVDISTGDHFLFQEPVFSRRPKP